MINYIKIPITFFLILITFQLSRAQIITITGHVKGINTKKVYLTDAYTSEKLDSANYENDKFEFKYHFDKENFEPFLVSIKYFEQNLRHVLIAGNNVLQGNLGEAAFMLEPENINISGDITKSIKLDFIGGRETKVLFFTQRSDFAVVGNSKNDERSNKIKTFQDVIKKFPFSYYLLSQIINCEHQYTKLELESLLELFDNEVQSSHLANNLKIFIARNPNIGIKADPVVLPSVYSDKNIQSKMQSFRQPLRLIVFWASWCGPCRLEIPNLKTLYTSYKAKGVNLVSVSLDKNFAAWQKALLEENLPWQQYILKDKDLMEATKKYDLFAVPTTILINNKGIPIARYTGMSDADFIDLKKTIDNYIRK